jgi:hypothetical protein
MRAGSRPCALDAATSSTKRRNNMKSTGKSEGNATLKWDLFVTPGIPKYIRDFDRLAETTTTARELYDQMLKLHPFRMNMGTLWSSARALKG